MWVTAAVSLAGLLVTVTLGEATKGCPVAGSSGTAQAEPRTGRASAQEGIIR
ncbi:MULTISPECIES: hypothetical protein [Nonomuraea]|uniref:Uncharacterized protein n=1 Tax=Nonomuraea mangrovi TaxID=2316207 RepID=A0ABW4STM5_9ACTN